ncbi:hypothetical protein ABPG72_015900 [Tetrahymena utriculariae]
MKSLTILTIFISFLQAIANNYLSKNITFIKQNHTFSEQASACPQKIRKLEFPATTQNIFTMKNIYLQDGQFATILVYTQAQPIQIILWDLVNINYQILTLQINGVPIQQISEVIVYDTDLRLLILVTTSDKFVVFQRPQNLFEFNLVQVVSIPSYSLLMQPLITDMFVIKGLNQLVTLDFNNFNLLFYDLINFTGVPLKVVTIGIPNDITPVQSAFYATNIPNTNYIALVDFSYALIRVINYVTKEIVFSSNDNTSNRPLNYYILGVYAKDSLVIFYNEHHLSLNPKKNQSNFQVFSADQNLQLISQFYIDNPQPHQNELKSMHILQNTPHVVTTHNLGDIFIHSLYSGEQIRHYKFDSYAAYDAQYYLDYLMFSSYDGNRNLILSYFLDWSQVLYPQDKDTATQGVCVSQCGIKQGYNQDLLACSTCDPSLNCKTCRFPSGYCDQCFEEFYLSQGICLPYCKGETGSATLGTDGKCQCNKGYYTIDSEICILNPCKQWEYPEYNYEFQQTNCIAICDKDLYYDIENQECICISGYIKIGSSCKLDVTGICLIIFFIVIVTIAIYKYRLSLIFQKSKIFFEVDSMQQGIKLKKFFESNSSKFQPKKNKQKPKLEV